MNKKPICRFVVLLAFFTMMLGITRDGFASTPDSFELNLPGGIPLVFKAVHLDIDGKLIFNVRKFKLGSREGDDVSYKERPTSTNLGGAFTSVRANGREDWLYYLGKTEVERRQWNAVMRWWQKKNGLPIEPEDNSRLPQTEKTSAEIFAFIEALNIWMIKNAKDVLPTYGNAKAYCRLPTEVEWEFAARGGEMVKKDVADRPYPYTDENGNAHLGGFEWYRSSSEKVKECGSEHIKPNPLGLYDMLGNVEELTYGIFGYDFLFARFGGLVVRGGNFSTDKRDINASRRTEYDGYTHQGDLIRYSKMGFRLALSTLVSEVGYLGEELDEAFELFTKKPEGAIRPGPAGKTSPLEQASEDLSERFETEKRRLEDINENFERKLKTQEEEYNKLKLNIAQRDNNLENLNIELRNKELQIETLKKQSIAKNDSEKLQSILNGKDEEVKRLQNEIKRLQEIVSRQLEGVETASNMEQELRQLKQEAADLKRRDTSANFEITKNLNRIRIVEMRLLEALMRIANYNLYSAWRNLKSMEIKKNKKLSSGKGLPPKTWARNQKEAENMLVDYRRYLIQITDDTKEDLFPEVKQKLIRWMEEKNANEQQINGLDLMERHIKEIRSGKYPQVKYLFDNLLTEPEMED